MRPMFRTLLVDDDFLVRSYLKTLNAWEKAGYEVVKDVQDGEEALHVLEEEKIDVIITDISMPLMDGIELIRHIREEKENIYIMVLSCHDDFEYVKEAMRLGADEYILKNTLDEDTLLEILESPGTRSSHDWRKAVSRNGPGTDSYGKPYPEIPLFQRHSLRHLKRAGAGGKESRSRYPRAVPEQCGHQYVHARME